MKKIFLTSLVFSIVMLSACTTQQKASVETTDLSEEQTTTPQQEIRAESTPSRRSGTFNDLLNTGTQQCTYTYQDNNTSSTGKIYIHNGQMKGDTTATVSGKEYKAHVLIRDNMMYSWEDSQKQGVKMDYAKVQAMADDLKAQSSTTPSLPDLNQKYDYDCSAWVPNPSTFSVPTEIQFMDLTQQMEQLKSFQQKMPSSGNKDACNACEQLTGNDKVQCIQVMKC